ncbi:MAG: hypothetical protein HRU20_29595 [Pseudomonadales bacterium]|nr:hypothetical protein [Pseudomonadales bacterium]
MTVKKSDKYWILGTCGESDSAVIMGVDDDTPNLYHLSECKSAEDIYSKPIKLFFSDLYQENVKLYDFLDNALDVLIVSANVKELFEKVGVENVEYISAEVFDHQENLVDKAYFILNPLKSLPIIDMEKSKVRMFNVSPSKISKIKKLVIDKNAMKEHNDSLFRADKDPSNIYITKELLEELQTAEISGLKAICADNWNGRELSLL